MSETTKRLSWDEEGQRRYETGVRMGVLYVKDNGKYGTGVAWNGLTSVNESPSGAEPTALYADDIKYLNILSAEEYAATIEAYAYPDEFAECNGASELVKGVTVGQQKRKQFGFCYRTIIGNDTENDSYGYKLHIVYGCQAAPTEVSHSSVNDSPDPATMSWSISTTPVNVTGLKPTATVEIDSTQVEASKLKAIEDVLYGTESNEPRLPLPDEIKTIIGVAA